MLVKDKQTENLLIYEAEIDDVGLPIKKLLKSKLDFSSRLLTKLKHGEGVFVNNKLVKYHQLVNEGDIIKIDMEEGENEFEPQEIPFRILYEDFDIIIIDKQPGIVTHPTKSHPNNTIANAAAYYLLKEGKSCKIRFVNRLDMDTSGLLIIAKNPYSHHVLAEMMKADKIIKKYTTFVEGIVKDEEGTINAPIYRPTEDSIKRTVDERGQFSLTKYKVLERYKNGTMLEVELLTGRTHQIRLHMSYIGHPIIGDHLYGNYTDIILRQALHASYLKLYQPRYKSQIEVKAPLPKDLEAVRRSLTEVTI